ncbi:MAG TPA: FkbM family methyltransferase [Xanthobacteraceae bacterium]|jgi:FkbM family methyltransferase
MLRSFISRATSTAARLVESHPHVWSLAWQAVHKFPFLLPHDISYRALRHFIALKPEGLFLDIGANDGISALSFRKFSKSYRILSLEPNPILEPALRKLKVADSRFDYRMTGVGVRHGTMKLFVPTYKNIVLHTFSSGDRNAVLKTVAESFGPSVARSVTVTSFDCEIVAGDDLNVDPAIIKIDAEGFDCAVLEGLTATIDRGRPFVVIEIGAGSYHSIKAYFEGRGYRLLAYSPPTDKFRIAPESWDARSYETPGYRNFFAVPVEMQKSLPFEEAVAVADHD